jgi:predicted transcriptional regulator
MSTPRIVSFRIAPEKVAELDLIAKAMDRDRSYLINEAVESYISEQRRFSAMVEEGRNDIRSGRSFSHEEVESMVDEWEREGR